MNQYSKDKGEAGGDTGQQTETEIFLFMRSRTKIFFNHRSYTSPFKGGDFHRRFCYFVHKLEAKSVREGREEWDRGWSGWYYCTEVRKTQCVFGINEAVWQDGGGNRQKDGVELWSSALSRAYPITLPLPWVKMPWFSTLHPFSHAAVTPAYCNIRS